METNIKRTALNITTFCNLKCKHCLAFIPYYENAYSMNYVEASNILKVYFQIVDTVEHFTVTGGEPLLNKDTYSILEEVYQYESQITGSIDFVTNGTMEISESLLRLFEEHSDKTKVILSNYGESLSTKIVALEEELKKSDINFRTSKFHGDNLYYDGWIDFSNHDLKWESIKERDCNAQKCVHRTGKYFVINNGELHCCSRSFWRIKNNIIPKVKGEYISLIDDTNISIEERRKELIKMYNMKSSTSCGYCVGLCNNVQRIKPAQQL